MISAVLGYLQGLRMSLTGWLALTAATVIAGLVALLKLQGSQIHKLQIELLDHDLEAKGRVQAAKVAAAGDRWTKALDAYKRAGGVLLVLLALYPLQSPAESNLELPKRCQEAVSACASLVEAQQGQIKGLEEAVAAWKKEASKSVAAPPLPWYGYVLLGVGVGALAVGASR